jgi:hypothetical protein
VVINPKNVTITSRARKVLDKSVLPGALSEIHRMRLVTIMLYSYGHEFVNHKGQVTRNDEANYLLAAIEPEKLTDEVIVELGDQKLIAIRFELPFSREKSYTVDFDGDHLIVY